MFVKSSWYELAMIDVSEINGRPRALLRILQDRQEKPEVLKDALAVFSQQLKSYLDWWRTPEEQSESQKLERFYIKTRQELITRTLNFLRSYDRLGLLHINADQIPELVHEVKFWEFPNEGENLLLALQNATLAMWEELEYELRELNSGNWHLLDAVFSKPAIEKMTLGYGVNPLKMAGKYLLNETHGLTNFDVVEALWSLLAKHRKNEHFYRETLLSHLLSHNIEKTTALAEVSVVGASATRSCFDLAIFGEEAIVFEIKSELDSPERLKTQLPNYRCVFKNAMVVASPRNYRRMRKNLEKIDPLAGLLLIGEDGEIELAKPSEPDETHLRKSSILRMLRKTELERILISKYGLISEARRGIYYKMLREMATEINVGELQELAMEQIRFRGLSGNEAFRKAPIGLKSPAYFLKLEKRKLRTFIKFLDSSYDQ